MSLKDQIIAEKGKGAPLTYKQGKLLYQLTKLKWWQPESMPAPCVPQATLLIGGCLNFIKTHEGGAELIDAIQIWFPDFSNLQEIHSRYFPKEKPEEQETPDDETKKSPSKGGKGGKSKGKPEKDESEIPEQKPEPKPEPAPKPEVKQPKGTSPVEQLINAGIRNIWMVGPAGCGKSTICQEVGKKYEIPVTVIPCGSGTSSTTFLGYKYPEREGTPFVHAFSQEGIIVLDEFTCLDDEVAQIINGALANDELTSTIGTFHRHEKCVIIATSNTFGNGADRMYVSNKQLDTSTIDRFAGGIVEIDYSKDYESQYDMEVTRYVWHMRDVFNKNGVRKVASTRSIISGCKLKAAGLDWKKALTTNLSKDEKALL